MRNVSIGIGLLAALVGWYLFWGAGSTYDIKNEPYEVNRIVCFGDSLTYGTGASHANSYPSRLGEMTGIEVINAGVPGDTTSDALARLEGDVLNHQPDVVMITLGGNDLKNRIDNDIAAGHLTTIIETIQNAGAMVILGGIDIPFYGKGYTAMYESVARQTGTLLIPNIFEGIYGKRSLMSDPIHPNDSGYEIMAGYFYKALKPYIKP